MYTQRTSYEGFYRHTRKPDQSEDGKLVCDIKEATATTNGAVKAGRLGLARRLVGRAEAADAVFGALARLPAGDLGRLW